MKLTRRKIVVVICVLPLVIVGLLAVSAACSPSVSDIQRIRKGMTRAEVEAIIGAPTLKYTGSGIMFVGSSDLPARTFVWFFKDGNLTLTYEESDAVMVWIAHSDENFGQSFLGWTRWRIWLHFGVVSPI